MKSRKQRAIQPRKGLNLPEEQQNSRSNIKHPSGHTKISTNFTVHSSVARPTIDKKPKSKKNNKANMKQQSLQVVASSSKSRRKLGLAIALRQQQTDLQLADPSWREYCLVDGNFLPITDSKQQQILSQLFTQTASSSCDAHGFGIKTGNMETEERAKLNQLRRRSKSSVMIANSSTDAEEGKILHEIGVETTKREKNLISTEVEAVIEKCEIGMQYSQRKNHIEQVLQQKQRIVVEERNVGNMLQDCSNTKQTITDLFFKLEFSHLGDDKAFSFLSSEEKIHFTQLLQNVITKMTPQPHKPQLKPISFQEIEDRFDCITQQSELYASPNHHSPRNNPESLLKETENQKLQQLICLREYRQLNLIEVEGPESQNNEGEVNTSLMSILTFLGHLFCYIEVHYSQQLVYMIGKMYGHTFKEKYKRITRGIPLNQDRRFRVVDEALFQDFINENDIGQYNYNETLHLKAVFDAFNQHLEEYRPYFMSNGQQFPWAFKMFIIMSEYSIDEDSLQIIFRQAKDKIVEWSTLFCGMLVDKEDMVLSPNNPLQLKHTERQNKMIVSWINQQNFQKDGLELFGTQTLHEAAEMIYNQLMEEFIREGKFVFN